MLKKKTLFIEHKQSENNTATSLHTYLILGMYILMPVFIHYGITIKSHTNPYNYFALTCGEAGILWFNQFINDKQYLFPTGFKLGPS